MCGDSRKAMWYVEEENQKTIKLKCRVCGESKDCPNPLDSLELTGEKQ